MVSAYLTVRNILADQQSINISVLKNEGLKVDEFVLSTNRENPGLTPEQMEEYKLLKADQNNLLNPEIREGF